MGLEDALMAFSRARFTDARDSGFTSGVIQSAAANGTTVTFQIPPGTSQHEASSLAADFLDDFAECKAALIVHGTPSPTDEAIVQLMLLRMAPVTRTVPDFSGVTYDFQEAAL